MSQNYWPGSGARYDSPSTVVSAGTLPIAGLALTDSPPYFDPIYGTPPWVDPKRTGQYPEGTFQQTFAEIYQEAFDLLVRKQISYGPANVEQLGFYGVFSRLASDKIERLRNLLNGKVEKGQVVLDLDDGPLADETLEDTLLDCLNYSAILIALRRGVWGRPLA